jgi:hypothetical protein
MNLIRPPLKVGPSDNLFLKTSRKTLATTQNLLVRSSMSSRRESGERQRIQVIFLTSTLE